MDLTACIEEIRALPLLAALDRSRFSVAEQDKYAAFFEMHEVLSRLREVLPEVLEAAGEEAREPGLPAVPKAVQAPAKQVLGEEPRDEGQILADSPEPDAGRTALGQTAGTQDTDDWDVGETDKGSEVEVLTDLKYDATAHTLTFRTRKFKFDPNGRLVEIDAEGDAVTVLTAVACPT